MGGVTDSQIEELLAQIKSKRGAQDAGLPGGKKDSDT